MEYIKHLTKLVDFETAKELKEKGFPQLDECPAYKESGELENGFTDLAQGMYYAPTYEMAQQWLIEKGIYVFPEMRLTPNNKIWFDPHVIVFGRNDEIDRDMHIGDISSYANRWLVGHTYSEVMAIGIHYALGLI